MRKKICLIIFTLFITAELFGQTGIEAINGFKYAIVEVLVYENDREDIHGITSYLETELSKKGIIVLDKDSDNWPQDAKLNPCLIGVWEPSSSSFGIADGMRAGFLIKNCKGEVVYESNSWARNMGHVGINHSANAKIAIRKAFKPILKLKYHYTESFTAKIVYPEVEKTNETEESMKSYLLSNTIDKIEGIYKSYQSGGHYKIGIIRSENKYKAIIVESESPVWKTGEVKAYFEPSSVIGIYAVKWLMGNKTPNETFAEMENEVLLNIKFSNKESGETDQSTYIKMFPTTSKEAVNRSNDSKSSGSGFVLSPGGIIATNAHVISNAKRIEAIFPTDYGTITYNAKILLSDENNDVALLQIQDSTFKGFPNTPIKIAEKCEVGERVFTIGYPLNEVMGTNYKLTDGIISSQSGIADDVRYYQISVPIQPGNSGGPLFNKNGMVVGIASAKLDGKAIGTDVQNVNYAIKSSYLLNLYNMLPISEKLEAKDPLMNKKLEDQVKVLKSYVCLIRVY